MIEEIDNVYVIWHREDYKKDIAERLEGVSVKVTYIKGPNGKDPRFSEWLLENNYKPIENWEVKDRELNETISDFQGRGMTTGEIACGIGHLEAWKQAKKDNAQRPLFLEQDAKVRRDNQEFKDIEPKINNYLTIMKDIDWDLFYLGICGDIVKTAEVEDLSWLHKTIFAYCLHAYIVTPKGIDILLNNNFEQNLCCPDENIHPSLQHLNGSMKAYNIALILSKGGRGMSEIVQTNWGDSEEVRNHTVEDSSTVNSPIYEPIEHLSIKYPELIVMDDFITDSSLLSDIDNDKEFWKTGYSWWNGWWMQTMQPPSNRHRLIEYIYRDHCPFPIDIEDGGMGHGEGFEHWVGITTPDDIKEIWGQKWALAPHQDKDEDYWSNHPQGKNKGDHMDSIITPSLGTIFYTEAPEEGGYLQIWDEYDFHKIDADTPYQIIKPKRNRLIIFDAGKVHGVTRVIKGTRKAVAINIWSHIPTTLMETN